MTPATDDRIARAGAWLGELHGRAREWVTAARAGYDGDARTEPYVDLLFAFGLARLGRAAAAGELLSAASGALTGDEAHRALLDAFRFRIEQALCGEPHRGPLPAAWHESVEGMDRIWLYVVDRARTQLRVLEPDQRINPYRNWGARISTFERELAALEHVHDPADLAARVDRLYRSCPKGARGREQQDRVLQQALGHASQATADATRGWLREAVPRLLAAPLPREPSDLGWMVSGAADAVRAAIDHRLTEDFLSAVLVASRMIEGCLRIDNLYFPADLLAACVRGFIAFHLPEDLDSFLGETSARLRGHKGASPVNRLCLLSVLAEGWYAFGWSELARPVLRETLAGLPNAGNSRDATRLACASMAAVRTAPADEARRHYLAVLDRASVRDTYTTSTHFSVSQLEVVEALVLSAVDAFRND